jgi:glutathione S-transferase
MLMSPDRAAFDAAATNFGALLNHLETELGEGPFFNGGALALVDCAFAPLFLRMAILEPYLKLGVLAQRPHIQAWSKLLLAHDAVQRSVVPNFADLLINSWRQRAPLGRELFAG